MGWVMCAYYVYGQGFQLWKSGWSYGLKPIQNSASNSLWIFDAEIYSIMICFKRLWICYSFSQPNLFFSFLIEFRTKVGTTC